MHGICYASCSFAAVRKAYSLLRHCILSARWRRRVREYVSTLAGQAGVLAYWPPASSSTVGRGRWLHVVDRRHGLVAIVAGSLATRTPCSDVQSPLLASLSLLLPSSPAPVGGRVLPSVSRIAVRWGCSDALVPRVPSFPALAIAALPPCPPASLLPLPLCSFVCPGPSAALCRGWRPLCSYSWLLLLALDSRRSGGLSLARSGPLLVRQSATEHKRPDRPPSFLPSKPLFSLLLLLLLLLTQSTSPTPHLHPARHGIQRL